MKAALVVMGGFAVCGVVWVGEARAQSIAGSERLERTIVALTALAAEPLGEGERLRLSFASSLFRSEHGLGLGISGGAPEVPGLEVSFAIAGDSGFEDVISRISIEYGFKALGGF